MVVVRLGWALSPPDFLSSAIAVPAKPRVATSASIGIIDLVFFNWFILVSLCRLGFARRGRRSHFFGLLLFFRLLLSELCFLLDLRDLLRFLEQREHRSIGRQRSLSSRDLDVLLVELHRALGRVLASMEHDL